MIGCDTVSRMKKYRDYLIFFIFAVAVIIAYKFFDQIGVLFGYLSTLMSILSPFIIGLLIAFVLYIPVTKLENLIKKIKKPFFPNHARGLSVAAVYLIAVGLIAVILWMIIPKLASSLMDLINRLPAYFDTAVNLIKEYVPANLFNIDSALEGFTPDKIMSYFDLSQLSTYAQGVFKFGTTVVNIFIAAIISVYMLLGKESLLRMLNRMLFAFIPKKGANVIVTYGRMIANTFYKYIYSQCLDAMIVGIACVIVFTIARVPYAALMGITVGVANLIPYFGAIISGVGVVLITLLSGEPVKAVVIAILILVIQQLDANIMQPKIVSNSVGIKPLYVLFAITVGGGLFGITGMIIGVPVVAVLKEIIENLMEYMEQRNQKRETAAGVVSAAESEPHDTISDESHS